jgi:hypothetical protein
MIWHRESAIGALQPLLLRLSGSNHICESEAGEQRGVTLWRSTDTNIVLLTNILQNTQYSVLYYVLRGSLP